MLRGVGMALLTAACLAVASGCGGDVDNDRAASSGGTNSDAGLGGAGGAGATGATSGSGGVAASGGSGANGGNGGMVGCKPYTWQCTADSDCCTGTCEGGYCTPACVTEGFCDPKSKPCCIGVCPTGPEAVCPIACGTEGTPCTAHEECCVGKCEGGKCFGSCKVSEPCTSDSECCSGKCGDGLCACALRGEACSDDHDCCNGGCRNGKCTCALGGETCDPFTSDPASTCCGAQTCQIATKTCMCQPEGAACSTGDECCGGKCARDASGGMCGSCKPATFPCAVHAVCCTGFCNLGQCTWPGAP